MWKMLQSGNYVVPYVGTQSYLRKPPLINWIVAASFKLSGVRNEWTARLPSALCLLAVALLLRTGSTLIFVVILLIPGTLPRYVLPLVAPFCWIIGVARANDAFEWTIRFRTFQLSVPRKVVAFSIAIGVVAAMIVFPLRSVSYLKKHERHKPVAARVNAVVSQINIFTRSTCPFCPICFMSARR
jgi:4-amino-4-deoxy-L-arabinose transferase-like glycosyltransferase